MGFPLGDTDSQGESEDLFFTGKLISVPNQQSLRSGSGTARIKEGTVVGYLYTVLLCENVLL